MDPSFPKLSSYEVVKKIGGGSFGNVYKAMVKATGDTVAVKEIKLLGGGVPSEVLREVCLLKTLQHPNIVRFHDVVHIDQFIYLVCEYVDRELKKDMNERVKKESGCYDDNTTKDLMFQIISGVAYCHGRGIIHRDLKPQNILFDSISKKLKIADFGLARALEFPPTKLTPDVVTIAYRAPEVLLGDPSYSYPVDMWSVGCIMAELVSEHNPLFRGIDNIGQLEHIFRVLGAPNPKTWAGVENLPRYKSAPKPTMHPQGLENILEMHRDDKIAFDLLSKMLCLNPSRRITAQEALQHDYFKDPNVSSDATSSDRLGKAVV